MNASALRGFGGQGSDQQVQENIARTQLEAVNHHGAKMAQAKAKSKIVNDERLKQLKSFAVGDTVTNGQKTGRVIRFEHDPAVLVVKIPIRSRFITERWAPNPQFVSKVPVK